MTIREQIRSAIHIALRQAGGSNAAAAFAVEPPADPGHGDYATNAALLLAQSAGKNPRDVAAAIAEKLSGVQDFIATAEVAGPGFVNITLRDGFILGALGGILEHPAAWGQSDIGKGRTVRVEYFQLNIAKRPHIGHLRSAIIGDAIKRMLLAFGYDAKSDTHVGDWGTQFGILLVGYKEAGKPDISGDPFDALEAIYQEENAKIEIDPSRRERAKEEFAKLERGDAENRKIWQWMVEISMQTLERTRSRLGLLPFDEHRGESA
jgi:arginyl-tRNA synthetase